MSQIVEMTIEEIEEQMAKISITNIAYMEIIETILKLIANKNSQVTRPKMLVKQIQAIIENRSQTLVETLNGPLEKIILTRIKVVKRIVDGETLNLHIKTGE